MNRIGALLLIGAILIYGFMGVQILHESVQYVGCEVVEE